MLPGERWYYFTLIQIFKSMENNKFNFDNCLSKQDYKEIVYNFIRAYDPEGYLIELEKKYLESNPRLHFELSRALSEVSETADNELTEIILEPDKFSQEEKDKRRDSFRFWRYFREIIDKRNPTSGNNPRQGEENPNPEFTTARQVLAIHYLLTYCKVDFSMIDKTHLSRFTQFLTGKEANNTKIVNTTIYKKWKAVLHKSDKKSHQDLTYIRSFFEKMGMTEVVKMIDNDMDSYKI
jgi:hypothetical protein